MVDDIEREKTRFRIAPYARQFRKRGLKGPEFMPITGDAQLTMELYKNVRLEAYRYAGRYDPEIDPQISNEYTQDLVDSAMSELGQAMFMTLQLMGQYMSKEDAELLVGPLLVNWPMDADSIRTPHAFTPTYDVRRNNHEFVLDSIDIISKIRTLDSGARIDGSGIAGVMMGWVDPGLTRFVRTEGQATQAEIDEQQSRIGKIAIGMQPPLPETGVNPQLRLDTIASTLKNGMPISPQLQMAFANPKSPMRAILDKEIQHYQFMLMQ
jgi:hypothetical protein